MAVSEKCEKCKVTLGFPSSREVLEKKRACPACGHTQKVEKSILYVVETLEEQIEWLSERVADLEARAGITARVKPQPVPPRAPVVHPPVDLLDIPACDGRPMPAAPDIDLFGLDPLPANTDDLGPATTLKDLI